MKIFSGKLVLICLLLNLGPLVATSGEASLVLIDHGQPKAVIVVGANPSEQARQAASELQLYLRRISGAELPIIEKLPDEKSIPILVGQAAAATRSLPGGLKIPSGLSPNFNDEGY